MDIAILRIAARTRRVGGVAQINKDEAGRTRRVARGSANSIHPVRLLIHHDIMRPPNRQALKQARQIGVIAERDGAGRVDVEQLGHVEDLDVVALGLAANHHVVLVAADLAPDAGDRVLRQPAQVRELAFGRDFGKGRPVGLPDGEEFASAGGRPAPGG